MARATVRAAWRMHESTTCRPCRADALRLPDLKALVASDERRPVYVPSIQPAQLRAAGFDEPSPLSDRPPLTGAVVNLALPSLGNQRCQLGQSFSLDGSGTLASQRILIALAPQDGQPAEAGIVAQMPAYVPAPRAVERYWQRNREPAQPRRRWNGTAAPP